MLYLVSWEKLLLFEKLPLASKNNRHGPYMQCKKFPEAPVLNYTGI